jgi:hypothetical protein
MGGGSEFEDDAPGDGPRQHGAAMNAVRMRKDDCAAAGFLARSTITPTLR